MKDNIISAALEVEECFWRTFPYSKGRPAILMSCIDDLRKALQEGGEAPVFGDDWVNKLRVNK